MGRSNAATRSTFKSYSRSIFGRGLRERLLMFLATNRPVHVQELATAVGADARKVRLNLEILERQGVVVRAMPTDGVGRFVALRRDNPLYRPLLSLLMRMEIAYPQSSVEPKPSRATERIRLGDYEKSKRRGTTLIDDADLFQSRIRTRVLLAIAACGETDAADLTSILIEDDRSVWNVVNHWEREGVVRSEARGRRRVLSLNDEWCAALELRRLLEAMIRIRPQYRGLAELSLRRIGGVREGALR